MGYCTLYIASSPHLDIDLLRSEIPELTFREELTEGRTSIHIRGRSLNIVLNEIPTAKLAPHIQSYKDFLVHSRSSLAFDSTELYMKFLDSVTMVVGVVGLHDEGYDQWDKLLRIIFKHYTASIFDGENIIDSQGNSILKLQRK